ncbi:MAG: sporulation integral membrane protein YtvI [Clostridiales bacterium]|nr:sporulation integral membrane protein YtvI [Clostridiales bacterium]
MYEKQKQFLVRLAYVAAYLLLFWLFFRYLAVWLLPFLIAMGLATLIEPCINFCRVHLHFKRSFSAAVFTLLLFGILITLAAVLIARLFTEAYEFLTQLPQYLISLPDLVADLRIRVENFSAACPENLRAWMETLTDQVIEQIVALFSSFSEKCLRQITEAVTTLPQIFLFCATTALAVFFTTSSFPTVMAFLRRQMTAPRLQRARGVKANLFSTLGKWLKAELILFVITFVQLFLGLLLIRQKYALLLSLLIALVDALPVFGIGTVLIPWALLCFLAGNVPRGIALIAIYAVISLVRSIMEPKIMAAQAGLSPLVALAAMYIGFCTFGVVGMILFPILLLFIKQLHDGGYLKIWK